MENSEITQALDIKRLNVCENFNNENDVANLLL